MGITYVDAEAVGPTGKRAAGLPDGRQWDRLLQLPENVWKAIELDPRCERTIPLADGTHVGHRMSGCWLSLDQDENGEHAGYPWLRTGHEALLGVITYADSRTYVESV